MGAGVKANGKWTVLGLVQLGILLCSIEVSIVFFALPIIASELKLSIASVQWVSVAFMITTGATLSLAGKLSDLLGRKTAYLIGFALFAAAAVIGGFATTLKMLVIMRIITALGNSFILSSANAITISVFPKEQHALALGVGATVFSVGLTIGVALGALILHFASWRWIFLINLPIGLIALVLGGIMFDAATIGRGRPLAKQLDLKGAALLMTWLTTFLLGIEFTVGGSTQTALGLLAVSLLAAVAFLKVEAVAADPVLPLSLFAIPEIQRGAILRTIMRLATSGLMFTLPFYLQRNLALSPGASGSVLFAFAIPFALGGPVSGYVADRFGARKMVIPGLALLFAGISLHLMLPPVGNPKAGWVIPLVIFAQAIAGLGAAMFGAPNTAATMQAVSKEHRGVASGLLWTTTYIGQSLGAALAALILQAGSSDAAAPIQNQQWVFGSLATALFIALLLAMKPEPKAEVLVATSVS